MWSPPIAEAAALPHRAIDIHEVIGGAAADIDGKRPEILLVLVQHHLRGGERIEDDILDLERDLLHAADGVFHPRADAVDDVKIGLELAAHHADGIEHALLPIDVIMLEDRVDEHVLRRGC